MTMLYNHFPGKMFTISCLEMYLDSTGSLAHPTGADAATGILLITILHKGTIPPHIVRTGHITPYLIVHLR